MKNIVKILIGMFLSVSMLTSCEQFDDAAKTKDVEPLKAVIKLNLNLGQAPTPASFNVKLTNYQESYELTTTVAPNGTATVENIIPGTYTITVSSEMSSEGFTYNYSGNLVNTDIVTENKQFTVNVAASKSGALIMKELYYCGSKTPTGGSYFRDQFYEIYNNSEYVQNVKGLCIGQINPMTATANLPVWPDANSSDYVYMSVIWQVPTDKDYPLNPGESIIIAQMADDHTKANLNPSCPVNLLSAEFETLVKTSSIIGDNPAINMYMAFWPSPTPQWLTTVFGSAFVIFTPKTPIDPNNYVSPVGRTDKNFKVPVTDIIDGVELVGNTNQMNLKRMQAVLDAGATTVGGTYIGKSVARKVKTTMADGRKIYYDTNNSTNDFEVMDTPVLRRNGAKAPAWNTWK